jgi:hypothetical protein
LAPAQQINSSSEGIVEAGYFYGGRVEFLVESLGRSAPVAVGFLKMNQLTRLIAFLGLAAGLIAIFLIHGGQVVDGGNTPNTVIFSSLLMLAFGTLLLEHWFTKPTDTIASAIAVLLTILPSQQGLAEMHGTFAILAYYSFGILILAALSIFLSPLDSSDRSNFADYLRKISTRLGSSRLLFGALFFLCLVAYSKEDSAEFVQLMAFAGIVILIDPKRLPSLVLRRAPIPPIGEVIGVQSRNTILARLASTRASVRRYDFVEFSDPGNEGQCRKGLIIDNWVLNSQQWIKIFSNRTLADIIGFAPDIAKRQRGKVYKITPNRAEVFLDRFVGTVYEGSSIDDVRFDYGMKVSVTEGTLLEIPFGNVNILYQVTQGVTKVEKLESKNEAGLIIGTATQVGFWKPDSRTFEKHGWLPEINKPVLLAQDIDDIPPEVGEYRAGKIPNTNFPIFINKTDAISHHTAILGVTGTGKSVFTRDLIRRVAADGTKVLIVDFTEEYRAKLDGNLIVEMGDAAVDREIYRYVDILAIEMAKFENNRVHATIEHAEAELRRLFRACFQTLSNSDRNIAILELPDVSNSNAILSYTRWAFKVLFEMARANELNGQRFCIVLEEAHTIIPEWNFVSSEDKSAKALVNQIGQIALQGRKYGVGFIVVAQRTANVSKTVLTQCNTVIAFRQFDRTSFEFLTNYMGEGMARSIASLQSRRAIVVGKAFSNSSPVIMQIPEIIE